MAGTLQGLATQGLGGRGLLPTGELIAAELSYCFFLGLRVEG